MSKTISKSHQVVAHKGRARKETIVAELSEKVNKSKGMVFTNYQGLTHRQLESLKKAVKKLEAEYVATKNTLLKLALSQTQNENRKTQSEKIFQFDLPTATLFLYGDPVEPIKHLAKMIKELKLPVVKFGVLEGRTISAQDVEKFATLPALPQLRAQFVWTLNAPIQCLHRALSWNMTKFVMTLKAIESKKSAS